MEDKNSYYVIIPAKVRYDKKLNPNAKLLYGEIKALCNKEGYCWTGNTSFSKMYKVSKTSISKWISNLEENGYIKTKLIHKEGSKQVLKRHITLIEDPIEKKLNPPTQEKLKDNNTDINNTSNTEKSFNYSKKYKIPTLSEIREYVSSENLYVNPKAFFDYYENSGWTEKDGPVRNWKMLLKAWSKNNNTKRDFVKESERIAYKNRNEMGASNVQSFSEIIGNIKMI